MASPKKSALYCKCHRACFFNVFQKQVTLYGASRTDAGVHAYGQVAVFSTDLNLDIHTMKRAINASLPPSILIRSLDLVSDSFNPRYDVIQKTYWYHFFTDEPLPWVRRFGYFSHEKFDLDLLGQALAVFVGTHDFRSFCTGNEYMSTVRTIDVIRLDFNDQLGAYKIVFQGKSFLRYMIRRIVGGCFFAAQKKVEIDELKRVLEAKNSHQRIKTAPAQGLTLHEISY